MTLRAWHWLGVLALELFAGCSGKSKRTQGLDATAGATGDGTSDTATPDAGSGATGDDSSASGGTSSGGSSGTSSGGAGGSSAAASSGHGGTGAASASPECVAYRDVSLLDACNELAPCAGTLSEYLDVLRRADKLSVSEARLGCGLVAIGAPADPVPDDAPYPRPSRVTGSELTFDSTGTLVGYFISRDGKGGPCDDYKYVRGIVLDESCDSQRTCPVGTEATDLASLCACKCPDPPPSDGMVVGLERCVLRGPVAYCEDTIDLEMAHPNFDSGLQWTLECGNKLAVFPDGTACVYDPTGSLLGVRRPDPSNVDCPGVDLWITEGAPLCAP